MPLKDVSHIYTYMHHYKYVFKHICNGRHIVLILLQSAFSTQHFVFENYPCWRRSKVKQYFRQWKHPSSLRKSCRAHTACCGQPQRRLRFRVPGHPSGSCWLKILLTTRPVSLGLVDPIVSTAATLRAGRAATPSSPSAPKAQASPMSSGTSVPDTYSTRWTNSLL